MAGGLSIAQERMLWECAQHKYGWSHVPTHKNGRATADVLVGKGLVTWGRNGRNHEDPRAVLTDEGAAILRRRWPVSAYVVGSYELPEDAHCWDAEPDPRYTDSGRDFYPGVPCCECGRFVGRYGSIEVEHFEMSSEVASVDGTCARCLAAHTIPDEGRSDV